MTTKAAVLYHAHCADGMASAWAAWKKLGDAAEYFPVSYGEPCPVDPYDRVIYFLDFCYKPEQMLEIMAKASDVQILDHHKTSKEDMEALVKERPELLSSDRFSMRFDTFHSGAHLTWDHFHPGERVPLMIRYVEDRDLWKFKLKHSREVAALVTSYPHTLEGYEALNERFKYIEAASAKPQVEEYDPVFREGVGILRYQERMAEVMAANFAWVRLDGHRVKMAAAPILVSEVGHKLALGELFSVTYLTRSNGIKQYSLRVSNDSKFDVGQLAKKFGGGGHVKAAGFEVAPGQEDPVETFHGCPIGLTESNSAESKQADPALHKAGRHATQGVQE